MHVTEKAYPLLQRHPPADRMREYRNNRAHEEVVVVGLFRMDDHRFPKRTMSGELENTGKRGPGGKGKEWTDCMAEDLRLFGITGDWSTAALNPGVWHGTVREGGCVSVAAWQKEEEKASEHGRGR